METLGFFSYISFIIGVNISYPVFLMFWTKTRDPKEVIRAISENKLYFAIFIIMYLVILGISFITLPILWSASGLVLIFFILGCIFHSANKHNKSLKERVEELKEMGK